MDDRLSTLRELMAAEKARNGSSQRTVDEIRQTLALFEESTGVARARDIRQAHLATFVDVMARLPESCRKSAAGRDVPPKEVLARTERDPSAQAGLVGATANRTLHVVARFLEFAEARGCVVDPKPTATRLGRRRKVRARDGRKAFPRERLAQVFAQPPRQGCGSERRRRAPGDLPGDPIVRDGRHWVPPIAAHSGMRRRAAAALKADEVTTEDGVPVVKLRMTAERPLKNASSERIVPIHPALIRHGLLEHVEAMRATGATDAFPELRPSGRGRALCGDGIDEFRRNTVRDALGAEAEELEFHSLRHRVRDELRDHADPPAAARSDVPGHAEADETDGRHGSDLRVVRKLQAIRRLPDPLALAAAQGGAERPERRRVRPPAHASGAARDRDEAQGAETSDFGRSRFGSEGEAATGLRAASRDVRGREGAGAPRGRGGAGGLVDIGLRVADGAELGSPCGEASASRANEVPLGHRRRITPRDTTEPGFRGPTGATVPARLHAGAYRLMGASETWSDHAAAA